MKLIKELKALIEKAEQRIDVEALKYANSMMEESHGKEWRGEDYDLWSEFAYYYEQFMRDWTD